MKSYYPVKPIHLLVILLGLFIQPLLSKAQPLKDSIPHVTLGKFISQLGDSLPNLKRIRIVDSSNQYLFEINLKRMAIQKIESQIVIIVNDTSFLLPGGSNILGDSVKIKTIKAPVFIDFNKGPSLDLTVNSESLLNEGEIDGFDNNAYNRTSVNFKLLRKEMPISGGYLFNTDNSLTNPWLGFYLNFDFEKYLAYRKERLLMQKPESLKSEILYKVKNDSVAMYNDSLFLIERYDSGHFDKKILDSISIYPASTEFGVLDSLSALDYNKKLQSNSNLEGLRKIKQFKSNNIAYDSIGGLPNTIPGDLRRPRIQFSADTLNYLKRKNLFQINQKKLVGKISQQDFGNLPINQNIPAKGRFGQIGNKYAFPKPKLQTLSVGRIFPDYGPLVLHNFSLVGLKTQIGLKNFTIDGFGGYHFQQSQTNPTLPIQPSGLNLSTKLLGIQPSYRISSGVKLLGTYLIGNNQSIGNLNKFNNENNEEKPAKTEVVGLGVVYKINESSILRLDWARSFTSVAGEELTLKEKLSEKMRNAFLLELNTTIKISNTNLMGGIRRIDPYYFSPGTPFLRNDLMAYKLRVTQPFFRNNLSIAGQLEHNSDNIYKLRNSTMESSLLLFKVSTRLKRKVSINLLSSQNYQKTWGEINVKSKTSLYQATISKMGKGRKSINNYMMIYSFLNSEFFLNQLQQHNLSIVGLFNYPASGFILTNTISGMRSDMGDSTGFTMAEIQASKNINKWITSSFGLNATESNLQMERFRLFGSLNLKIGKAILSPYFERYWTFNEKKTGKNLYKINFYLNLQY